MSAQWKKIQTLKLHVPELSPKSPISSTFEHIP